MIFLDDEDNLSQTTSNRSEESKLGFNMCECGFEGIAIKVAKRSSNQDECPHELASGILGMVSNKVVSKITIFCQKYFRHISSIVLFDFCSRKICRR